MGFGEVASAPCFLGASMQAFRVLFVDSHVPHVSLMFEGGPRIQYMFAVFGIVASGC